MIRTRDFLLFSLTLVFLLTGITTTLISQSWDASSQVASVVQFNNAASAPEVVTVLFGSEEIPRSENIERLQKKIASGQGNVAAGDPVFTSVDTGVTSTAPVMTDSTAAKPFLIGRNLQGEGLYSSDLWRYHGFSREDQIGFANNGFPIFGAREDDSVLDQCGGVDEGFGYRYYLQPSKDAVPECFL